MAINTIDDYFSSILPPQSILKGSSGTLVAGRPYSYFYTAGVPGAAVAPTPGLSGAALTSYSGQIPIPAASGTTYLAEFNAGLSGQGGSVVLYDRLWHNSGINITSTSPQTINSVGFPARDRNLSTNGEGVYLALEVSTATGAGTPTITVGYTNSDGVSGRVATNIIATVASSAAGTFYLLGLDAGDVGVRSIQNLTLSATWTSGTVHLVAFREIDRIAVTTAGLPVKSDGLSGSFLRQPDNIVPAIYIIPQTTTATLLSGSIKFAQG